MCHTTSTPSNVSTDEPTENTVANSKPNTKPNTEPQAGQFIRTILLVSDLLGQTYAPPSWPLRSLSGRLVSLLLCLGTCIGLAWYDSPSNTAVLPAGEIGTVGGASLRRPEVEGWAGYAPSLLEISRVRVGMRMAAENPEVSDAERKDVC